MVKEMLNALITGNQRSEIELALALRLCFRLRDEGKLKRIVMSTWLDEFSDSFKEVNLSRGVEFIEQEQPVEPGIGNSYRQYRTFASGLSVFAADDIVLKMRTDLNSNIGAILKSYDTHAQPSVKKKRLDSKFFVSPAKFFSSPVFVSNASIIYPGRIHESCFAGSVADLRSLAHFSGYFSQVPSDLNDGRRHGPEFMWFGYPFLLGSHYNLRVTNQVNLFALANTICDAAVKGSLGALPEAFFVHLVHCIVFNHSNLILPKRRSSLDESQGFSLEDILSRRYPAIGRWEFAQPFSDFRVADSRITALNALSASKGPDRLAAALEAVTRAASSSRDASHLAEQLEHSINETGRQRFRYSATEAAAKNTGASISDLLPSLNSGVVYWLEEAAKSGLCNLDTLVPWSLRKAMDMGKQEFKTAVRAFSDASLINERILRDISRSAVSNRKEDFLDVFHGVKLVDGSIRKQYI